MIRYRSIALVVFAAVSTIGSAAQAGPRAREAGIVVGLFAPGPLNAITDVAGVSVGHVTLKDGPALNTGVTAVLPHGGNLFQDKVPAGFAVANGFGKFAGSTQLMELGEVETPILMTNTLSVPEAMAGAVEWTLAQPGNEEARSVNAVVGETNDGFLNDIRARRVTKEHAKAAIAAAKGGPVAEGAVGAGTGTVAFGFKGGIGTASRKLAAKYGGYTVGVLVQSNYGGSLTIAGVPVDKVLGRDSFAARAQTSADGSVILVVATDAPLSDRNLARLAERSFVGIGRTGSPISNGSGDYAVAFSTHPDVRRTPAKRSAPATSPELPNDLMSPLFQAVTEAAEEAVLNSMFAATRTVGHRGTIEALPVDTIVKLVAARRR